MGISSDIKQTKFHSDFQKVIINLFYTNNWLQEKHSALFKSHGLTIAQYNVLRILRGQYPKPATVNLIIDRMLDRMSNASRIVDKLLEKQMVERTQNEIDRRAVDILISTDGLELLEKIDEELDVLEKKINQLTKDECKKVNSFLDRLRGSEPD